MQKKIASLFIAAAFVLNACTPAATATSAPTVEPAALPATTVPTEAATPPPEPTTAPTAEPPALMELTDSYGTTLVFNTPFERIISLAPSNTELVFGVGAGDQLIARDAFSDFPEAVFDITDIGGGWGELDIETIISLDPDLILTADIIAPEQNQSLQDLGLTVFNISNPLTMDEMYANIALVGTLTGRTQEAAIAIVDAQTRVLAVQGIVAGAETTPLVFYQIDSTDPAAPWTTGPGTFMDTLITMAGGQNVGGVLADAWAQISLEELITQNPAIILMGDAVWSGETPEDVAAREGWQTIAAVEIGQIYVFDDNLVSRPGPRMVDGLELLAKLIHPELFD